MKIKKIEIINNPVLGNMKISFVKKGGSFFKSIILIGENGSGKTTLLNIIYNITNFKFENCDLGKNEIRKIRLFDEKSNNSFRIVLDGSKTNNILVYDKKKKLVFTIEGTTDDNDKDDYMKHVFVDKGDDLYDEDLTRKFLIDDENIGMISLFLKSNSVKGTLNSGNKNSFDTAKDLLNRISSLDNEIVVDFIKSHPGKLVSNDILCGKTEKFIKAFNFMFTDSNLSYLGTKKMEPVFEKKGNIFPFSKLSSGEEQIVKNGSMILDSIDKVNIVFIDEPEDGMHPLWQKRIFDYYKMIIMVHLTGTPNKVE